MLSAVLAKVNKPNKYILISHKHKLIPWQTHIGISLSTGEISLSLSLCVSYGISLYLCEIRIYLFGLFTFAKIPDYNHQSLYMHCFGVKSIHPFKTLEIRQRCSTAKSKSVKSIGFLLTSLYLCYNLGASEL